MKTVIAFVIAVILILVCATAASAEWVPGTVHAHSSFSDGQRNPNGIFSDAVIYGSKFLIMTDHYEQIGKKDKAGGIIADDFGYDKYCQIYNQTNPKILGIKLNLIVIPGAEVETWWDNKKSHTLVFPITSQEPIIDQWQLKNDTQQNLINDCRKPEHNYMLIAAHPYSWSEFSLQWRAWEDTVYPYDRGHAENINGIEFFNDGKSGNKPTRDWYLSEIAKGKDIFVTAGCDSHNPAEPGDSDRWKRKTWVWVEGEPTKGKILDAFRNGRTYASQYGAYIKDINYLPGFDIHQGNEIVATLAFPEVKESKTVNMYVDGQCINLTSMPGQEWNKGQNEYSFRYNLDNLPGKHTIIIEIENCLITSPIKIDVSPLITPTSGSAIAVVVDRSGSMSGDKIDRAKQAASGFFATLAPQDHACLVSFTTDARLEVGILQATSQNKIKLQEGARAVQAGESTNITAGLNIAFNQLTAGPLKKAILLLSDGMHNTGPGPLDGNPSTVQIFADAGWPIYTVAYGTDADQKMLAEIAQRTGGTFFPAGLPNITQVYHKISAHAHNQSVLFAYNDLISQGKQLSYQIPVDADIASATFFADWQGSIVELCLTTPEGQVIKPDNFGNFPGVVYQKGDTFCFYEVHQPKPGDWQANLLGKEINQPKEQVNFTVSGSSPLMTNISGFQPSYRQGQIVQITAKIIGLFGPTPAVLQKVKVTAEIKKPGPNLIKIFEQKKIDLWDMISNAVTQKTKLTLYDDGRHNDGEAGDGIFSAEYKGADTNGCYLITVKCETKKPDGKTITRILKESIQVGPIEDNEVSLADFLGL